MDAEPEFRPNLYRGTARFYDTFRVLYPARGWLTGWVLRSRVEHITLGRRPGIAARPRRDHAFSHVALGSHAPAFEQDLHDRLLQVAPDNVFHDSIGFHYTLARLL